MSTAATTREYLALRISELQNDVKLMSPNNGAALLIEHARIDENKRTLRVLNGGTVPAKKEVSNAR